MNNGSVQSSTVFPFKVYLLNKNSDEHEIRRFNIEFPIFKTYEYLVKQIREFFPELSNKEFTISWEDEEGEKVVISSDRELAVAMKSKVMVGVKKLYVKVKSSSTETTNPNKDEEGPLHYGVFCDECNRNITGIRYKCGKCIDFDLCSGCREADCHSYHPMFRIPHPDLYVNIMRFRGEKHRGRRHSDAGKKKRSFEKRESGPETGDEVEDMHHEKHSHKKCKKAYKCMCKRMEKECGKTVGGDEANQFCRAGPYSQLVNDFLGYFNPVHFAPSQSQNPTDGANDTEIHSHISYLKNLGSSLQKILDPLGVNVEFEVRQKGERTKETKNEKEEKQPSESSSSTQPQKEVRFPTTEQLSETINQKIEDVTKILSSQTISNDNDNGWVSFEELKRGSEEPQPSSSAEAPKTSPSAPEDKKEEVNGNETLYPNLTSTVSSNPAVVTALKNMLKMGFTNEGNWLAALLEAKNGDINQALEALSFQEKFTK